MRRWKIERFHYALKRMYHMEKMTTLILLYPIIAGKILNMTYRERLNQETPCPVLLGQDERKLLYCVAHRLRRTRRSRMSC
jgi:hypothetical protein